MIARTITVFAAYFTALVIVSLADGLTREDRLDSAHSDSAPSRPSSAATIPGVPLLMGRVERILVTNGYPAARGYRLLDPPGVFFAGGPLPRGDWGWSVPGTILLSPDQPPDCVRITLAHELAHDATRRRDLLSADSVGAPVWAIRAEMERIAAIVETAVANDNVWVPNCLMRRGIS